MLMFCRYSAVRHTVHVPRPIAFLAKALSVVLLQKLCACTLSSCQSRYRVVNPLSHVNDDDIRETFCTCVSCASQDMFGAAESKSTGFAESPRHHREPQHARLPIASMSHYRGEQRGAEINRRQIVQMQLYGMSIDGLPGSAESLIAQGDPNHAALVHDCMRS